VTDADLITPIADPADARLADYRDLTDVALRSRAEPERGLFMAESIEVIRRAIDAGIRPRSMLMATRWLEPMADVIRQASDAGPFPVYVADEDVLRGIVGFRLHRGAIAAMHRPQLPSVSAVVTEARRVVVLEAVVDHTNVGAVFRSVAGLGAHAVLVSPQCADPLYRRSVRVSMGTVFQVPWTRAEPWPDVLDSLRGEGFVIVALALTPEAEALDSFCVNPPERIALVLGAEGDGLSRQALQSADRVVRVPMSGGVDSLNVAAAAAVALWALRLG
jgi:tRNA G18 (ribose-2'-O)-methylase SpoU